MFVAQTRTHKTQEIGSALAVARWERRGKEGERQEYGREHVLRMRAHACTEAQQVRARVRMQPYYRTHYTKQNSELLHAILVIFTVSSKPSIAAARPWCRFQRRTDRRPQSPQSCIRELHNLRSVAWIDFDPPTHPSRFASIPAPSRLVLRSQLFAKDISTNCLSARREDLVFNKRQV